MKNIAQFIKESLMNASKLDKYYKKISDFKDGDVVILGYVDDDNHATPMPVVVRKHNKDIVFVNPDDDRDMNEWTHFLNYEDTNVLSYNSKKHIDSDNPEVLVADNDKEMQQICDIYNKMTKY